MVYKRPTDLRLVEDVPICCNLLIAPILDEGVLAGGPTNNNYLAGAAPVHGHAAAEAAAARCERAHQASSPRLPVFTPWCPHPSSTANLQAC